MKATSSPCCGASRSGLTLVEVLAGLALLAGLLIAAVLASARHAAQVRAAGRRLDAIDAADRLLVAWFAERGGVPPAKRGTCAQAPFRWRAETLGPAGDPQFGLRKVRLSLFAADAAPADAEPLARVEFVLPDNPPPEDP